MVLIHMHKVNLAMVTVHTCSTLSLSNTCMYSEGHKHATDVKLDSTVCSRQDTKSELDSGGLISPVTIIVA